MSPNPTLECLVTRHSVGPRHLRGPVPTEEELWWAASAAMRGPDHGKLTPYRFVVLPPGSRKALASLFADFARRAGGTAQDIGAERARALRGPLLVAFIVRIQQHEKVPAHEQWMAAGGALSNFMTALHAMGYASKMVSGHKVEDPEIRRAFCEADEKLVGWIAIGTPIEAPHPRSNESPEQVLQTWTPPPRTLEPSEVATAAA